MLQERTNGRTNLSHS